VHLMEHRPGPSGLCLEDRQRQPRACALFSLSSFHTRCVPDPAPVGFMIGFGGDEPDQIVVGGRQDGAVPFLPGEDVAEGAGVGL
jgi:hypothetical protein